MDFIISTLVILFFCLPLILVIVLICMVRRRRKLQREGYSAPQYGYKNLVEPFSFSENWLTCTILFFLTGIYLCEVAFAFPPSTQSAPSVFSLVAFGGVTRGMVLEHGQWYRLLTAPLLHGSFMHLAFNGVALFYAGRILEPQLGRAWLLMIYFIGGLCGSLLSISLNEGNIVSVGASGAIMGLFAAIMGVSFHSTNTEKRIGLRFLSLRVIIPSLLPQASSGMHIDYAAHFGGIIGGTLCVVSMLICWPHDESLPRLRSIACVIATAFFLATCYSAYMVNIRYPAYKTINTYRESCINTMTDFAKQHGYQPEKYLKKNTKYLETCLQYYIKNSGHTSGAQ